MFLRVDHIELIVKDLDNSLSFYIEKLGFSLISRQKLVSNDYNEAAMIGINDIKVELLSLQRGRKDKVGKDSKVLGFHLPAFEVFDMTECLTALSDKAIKPSWGPKLLGDSIRAEIQDLDGNNIELRQWLTTKN